MFQIFSAKNERFFSEKKDGCKSPGRSFHPSPWDLQSRRISRIRLFPSISKQIPAAPLFPTMLCIKAETLWKLHFTWKQLFWFRFVQLTFALERDWFTCWRNCSQSLQNSVVVFINNWFGGHACWVISILIANWIDQRNQFRLINRASI